MYKHKVIEKKWQKHWLKNDSFKTTNDKKKKFYVLDMFPYPSGKGLHVGHPKGYTATDIIARYKRLKGYDVLHPIGWDAFGLPAEQYAIQTGNLPNEFTIKNINNFRKQLQSLGFSYDYDKEVNTTDPNYYKFTQWIFKKMYENNLAQIKKINVNWCEKLGTVLANEELVETKDGSLVSERGGFPVIKRPMKQWVLKITKYASRLFDDLEKLDWPSSLVLLQKNWIKNKDGSLRLKDWVFSRQRYWGEPFPIAFDKNNKIVLIDELPLILPKMKEIKPSGSTKGPLFNNKKWLYFEKNGKKYRRETNTMPQWAGSSWYYLAYILKNKDGTYTDIESKEAYQRFKKWLPIDLYVGGQEHATLHLIYARFWHKFLYDLKIVPTKEPFKKIINQGMILGSNGQKMSKSKGNIINPDGIIEKYGADTLRIYLMFMGPLEDSKPWNNTGVIGIKKWLDRVYKMYENIKKNVFVVSENQKISSSYNKLVKEFSNDLEKFKFNVAISKLMVFVNNVYKEKTMTKESLNNFPILLSLFAPHLSEEILNSLKQKEISKSVWPKFDESKIIVENIIIAVQVNGKLRGKLSISNFDKEKNIIQNSKKIENVKKFLNNKKIIKQIYIKNKIINFIVK